jgi:ferredoxin-NADP reductase
VKPWLLEAAPSSVLAAVSTLHVALALIRKHRSADPMRGWQLASLSALFAVSAWVWTSPRDLAVGGGAHLVWFAISASLGGRRPAAVARPATRPVSAAPPGVRVAAPAAAAAPKQRGFAPTPVLAVFDETPEIRTFRLVRPEGYEFRAGQFITLQVQIDGHPITRCYSISSGPEARGYLEISVKRQGVVSSTLHSTVRPGSTLSIRPPAGAFVYPKGDDRPLVLVSGGVGCTPMISMLRHAVACEPSRPVVYLFSGKKEEDIAFRQELGLLSRRHPQVRIVIALTQAGGGPQFYAGRIDENLVRQVVPDPLQSLFYICGPQAMIEGTKALLARLAVPAAQVRSEAFAAAVAGARAAVPVPAPEPAREEEEAVTVAAIARPASGATACVRLAVSGKTVTLTSGQTLLEAAETVRVEIPNVCRAGVCGSCKTRLVSGDVECTADVMEDSDRDEGYVFPCVAWAKGDCVLEA